MSPDLPLDVSSAGRDLGPLITMRGITKFEDLLVKAAEAYRNQLAAVVRLAASEPLRTAAEGLRASIAVALATRTSLEVARAPFTATSLHGVARTPLMDQCQLGFGCDSAPIVAIGTEQGWSADDDLTFALSHCAVNLFWLTGSPTSLVLKIADRATWHKRYDRPFVVLPADYYTQGRGPGRGRDTSKVLAEIVEFTVGWRPTGGFLAAAGDQPCLGDLTYMLDLAVAPARYHAAGNVPSKERIAFLRQVFERFRDTARAVIFYGKLDRSLDDVRNQLADIFLGSTGEREPVKGVARPTWWRRAVDGRIVIFTAPLNMSIPQAHSRELASYLRPALATHDFSWTVK
jgi:hypothetical protein